MATLPLPRSFRRTDGGEEALLTLTLVISSVVAAAALGHALGRWNLRELPATRSLLEFAFIATATFAAGLVWGIQESGDFFLKVFTAPNAPATLHDVAFTALLLIAVQGLLIALAVRIVMAGFSIQGMERPNVVIGLFLSLLAVAFFLIIPVAVSAHDIVLAIFNP